MRLHRGTLLAVVALAGVIAALSRGDSRAGGEPEPELIVPPEVISHAPDLVRKGPFRLTGTKSLLNGYAPTDADGNIQIVVEIPTGTNAKWEVEKESGDLCWEMKEGKPRVVRYLGYPGNYGMIPRTLLPKEMGGDGDPLDVLVLGPAVARGSVVKARLIGVLKLLDGGEQDDKLLAVMIDSPLGHVKSVADLDESYRGITTIVETWFVSYKGPGVMESKGFAGVDEAKRVLGASIAAALR